MGLKGGVQENQHSVTLVTRQELIGIHLVHLSGEQLDLRDAVV